MVAGSGAGVAAEAGGAGVTLVDRAVEDEADPNKVYEISMSTVIKFECEDCVEKPKYIEKGRTVK